MIERLLRPLDRFFQISERESDLSTELLGGLTHFVGNFFNLVTTASILSAGGAPFVDSVTGGAWAGFIGQMSVGLFSNLPICISAGGGPNYTVAYLLAQSLNKGGLGSYDAALTCCLVSGLIIVVLTALGAISTITNLVPTSLKLSISVGIGLLSAFVGFQQVGMVVRSDEGLIGPGDFFNTPEIWLSFGGLLFLTLLQERGVKGAVLVSMVLLTVVEWTFVSSWPELQLDPFRSPQVHAPDTSVLRTLDFWKQVLGMVLMLVFDAMGCIFGLARLAGRVNLSGQVEGGNGMFYAVGLSSAAAAICGVSPMVISGPSACAIQDGARTGLSTCVSGCLFLLIGLPLASTLAAMPACVSSFALLYVGVSMTADAAQIQWEDPIIAVPAFLCIICQPLLFSIADGICAGLTASLILSLLSGRMFAKESAEASTPDEAFLMSPMSPRRRIELPSDGFQKFNMLRYQGGAKMDFHQKRVPQSAPSEVFRRHYVPPARSSSKEFVLPARSSSKERSDYEPPSRSSSKERMPRVGSKESVVGR